jgi:hypothetical protein
MSKDYLSQSAPLEKIMIYCQPCEALRPSFFMHDKVAGRRSTSKMRNQ